MLNLFSETRIPALSLSLSEPIDSIGPGKGLLWYVNIKDSSGCIPEMNVELIKCSPGSQAVFSFH